jgi:hypothetical protein
MAYTLNGYTLPNVQSCESNKDSQLFQMPLPGSDSSGALALDLMGASRTITIRGQKVDTEANCKTFIVTYLDAWVNGSQSAVVFHADISDVNYTVYVQSVRWEYKAGEVGVVDYTITLMECSG